MNTKLKILLANNAATLYTRETGLASTSQNERVTLWNEQAIKVVNNKAVTKQVQDIIFAAIKLTELENRKSKGQDQ